MARGRRFAQDRLAERLIGDARVPRLLVGEPARTVQSRLYAMTRKSARAAVPGDESRALYRPVARRAQRQVSSSEAGRHFGRYVRGMARAAEKHGLSEPAVITTSALVAGFGDFGWARSVTFYATDNWTAYSPLSHQTDALAEAFDRISERAYGVVTVSQPIVERIAPAGPSLVLPNGIEPDDWQGGAAPAPSWFESLPRPRVVYMGTVDDRLDVDAILAVADSLEEGTVVLIGAREGTRVDPALTGHPRVSTHAPVPRDQVPAILRAADVGIVPHVRTPLTEGMSPLKLYEYLAAGLPVIATDLEPMRDVHGHVELVGPDDWADAAAGALRRGRMDEPQRLAFIDANAWASRYEQLLAFALR